MEHPHCPFYAASDGFFYTTTSPTPEFYLADAELLFFPAGELLSKSVATKMGNLTYQAVFLPDIYSPPLGFRKPTNIRLDAFVRSIKLLGRAYTPFLSTIDALQPLLDILFSRKNRNPNKFAIPTCSYASL
jgi:hypothetical protein